MSVELTTEVDSAIVNPSFRTSVSGPCVAPMYLAKCPSSLRLAPLFSASLGQVQYGAVYHQRGS